MELTKPSKTSYTKTVFACKNDKNKNKMVNSYIHLIIKSLRFNNWMNIIIAKQ